MLDWEGSQPILDVSSGIGLEIYGINDKNEKVLIQKTSTDDDLWSSYGGYYENYIGDSVYYLADGAKCISYVVQLNDIKFKYNKLNIRIYYLYEDRMISYRYSPLYINYVNTTQELERTATDIHLIAWEES